MDTKPIASTFSEKSDSILAEIMQKNKLAGSDITIIFTRITMSFSRGEIDEGQMIDSIQKETNVSAQAAQQIAVEIKNRLISTLWDKMSEEEKESLLSNKNSNSVLPKNETAPAFINIKDNKKLLEKERGNIPPPIKQTKGKSTLPKKTKAPIEIEPEEVIPQSKQLKGPDSYREPIE